MSKQISLRIIFVFIVASITAITVFTVRTVFAQSEVTDTCDAVRYLMANNITPYDMEMGGGLMGDNAPVRGEMPANHYSDFWSFTVTQENESGTSAPVVTAIQFENFSDGLEFALFRGMLPELEFMPLADTEFIFDRDDTYTIVVRRTDLLDTSRLEYSLSLITDSRGQINPPEEVDLSNSIGEGATPPSELNDGQLSIQMPLATVLAHADAINLVNTRQGQSTQVYFPDKSESNPASYTLQIDEQVQDMRFLAGDMALSGRDRIYFLKNYNYMSNLDSSRAGILDLTNITYADGSEVAVTWDIIQGIWVLDTCAGFKLKDGRSFIGTINAEERFVSFTGNLDEFTIAFAPPESDIPETRLNTTNIQYQAQFNWAEIQAESEINYANRVFDFPLTNDRHLALQSTNIQIISTEKTDVILRDIEANLTLDWINMATFALRDEVIHVGFTDEPRASAIFERSAVNLQQFEAINDIIRITYKSDTSLGANRAIPGEERLIVSVSEGSVEIITPQGLPPFDGRAMPDQEGYMPRALNNTGAECYPVNTILPEANCPPNGELNPANGNLFYAVEDMSTFGSNLNLEVIRSYNSRLTHLDSPFGFAWSTPFRLDYNVPFNTDTASRQITPDLASQVGLDVTWASRGIVTYITPTGSRHQFVSDEPIYDGGTLTAVTMPNWTLFRESRFSETWILEQIDGLTYTFDRVGRMQSYTNGVQTISVTYPYNSANGANSSTEGVVISDGTGRQIAFYYNDDGHIIRSVLSDSSNELTTQYSYTDGFLTGVIYPDGTRATYVYDETGHLIEHDDPRAPIHPHMRYSYDADGNVETVQLVSENNEVIPHRFYSLVIEEGSSNRRAIVIDENNNRREYIYRATQGELKAPSDTFTLTNASNPLAEVDDLEYRGQRYQYENGLMIRITGDTAIDGQGRGAVSYEYNDFGQIQCIACIASSRSVPSLEIIYQPDPNDPRNILTLPRPIEIHYANGTVETFDYDENGQITTHTDTNGAIYAYEWADGQIAATIRQQDEERIDYRYNSAGQIISEVRTLGESIHQIEYEYDWLGRVTAFRDSASGNYTVAYNDTEAGTEIIVTDPIGVNSSYVYDSRNRLVEMSVSGNEILSLTTYAYDIYDNLTEETQWLIDEASGIPITTTYLHERRPTIPPLTEEDAIAVIKGTQITVTRPELGEERYSFDALGRIRRVEDPFQRTYYDYVTTENSNYHFGMLIQQRTLMGGATQPNMINYLFDSRYQLREVRSERQRWEIGVDGDNSIRQDTLRMLTDGLVSGLQSVAWSEYSKGVPTFTDVRQGELRLQSSFNILNAHRAGNRLELDFEGRPTAITNGAGELLYIAYCPAPNGAIQEIYARAVDVTCDSSEFDVSMTYDTSGRLVSSIDEIGTRTFNYIPQPDTNTWQVEVVFSNAENDTFTWNMVYDGLGNLVEWRDADGFVHRYTYDTLGRLTSTTVQDQPENSYTFRYNDANLLIEQVNGLGQGFVYEYNDLGQVIIRLDKATADTTNYTYTPDGKLSTIMTSDGSMTSYLYEDTLNSERLTAIIEPTGSRHTFTWDDQNNTLIYTDPLQNVTTYYFDGNGLLWRIDDPLQISPNDTRTSEILYNDAGQVEALLFDSRPNNTSQTNFTLEHSENGTVTIQEDTTNWASSFSFAPTGELLEIDGLSLDYDPLGRLASIVYNENSWTLTRTDGNPLISLVDGYGNATELRYDSLFREISKLQNGEVINTNYNNNVIAVTLPDGTVNTYIFSLGNIQHSEPTSVTRLGNGFRIRYLYNQNGLLTEIRTEECYFNETDINTCTTQIKSIKFIYDDAGRPLSVIDADGNFETFTYDAVGNLAMYQTENGQHFNYAYDEAGRLSHLITPSGLKLLIQRNTRDRVVGICRTRAEAPNDYASCVENGGVLENYAYDALGRMTQRHYNITIGTEDVLNYQYNFETTGALTAINGQDFSINMSYTDLGRLSNIQNETSNVSFAYDLPDTPIAQLLPYTSDERGRLSNINDGTLTLNYPELTSITIARADGLSIQQQINQSGDVQAINYGAELSVLHQTDATGYIQRQVINMPEQNISYSITIGYDNDKRPLLMQITNVHDLQTLYMQTFIYDEDGLLIQETRQYQDDTRAIINYEYANSIQLTRQVIRIIRPVASNSQESENGNIFTVDYIYDEFANLVSVIQTLPDDTNTRIECARYDYDVLNRLIRVHQTNTSGSESLINYSYDSFNRLITAGNYTLNYDGNRLFSVSDDTTTHYFGGLSEQAPAFVVDENGNITWLYNDGRERIVGNIPDGDTINTIWLFDPLRRYISLDSPLQNINACQLSGIPHDVPEYLVLQPYSDTQIWDSRTNLYITDGRAYDPEQARYLQGRLLELNPSDYLYGDFIMHDELPLVAHQPAYKIGLDILHDAEMNIASIEGLSAEAVIQQFVNTTPDTAHPLVASLMESRTSYTDSMRRLLNLPVFLQTQYNLPSPYRDSQTGALIMLAENVVAMGGRGQNFTLYPVDTLPNWSDYQLGEHLSHMPEINSTHQPFHAFVPWSIDRPSYQDIHNLPFVLITGAPNDVWNWLPKNIESPVSAVTVLDFAEMITQMPSQPRYVWVENLLNLAMPNEANLPVQSSDEWLEKWFTNDTFNFNSSIPLQTISENPMSP